MGDPIEGFKSSTIGDKPIIVQNIETVLIGYFGEDESCCHMARAQEWLGMVKSCRSRAWENCHETHLT